MTTNRASLTTEQPHPASSALDTLSSLEFVELMNQQNAAVDAAVRGCALETAQAIDLVAERLGQGGRYIIAGAGTSGRLGVLDASECPPTFLTGPELVQAIIAGGEPALRQSVEGAEDNAEAGVKALRDAHCSSKDVVCGISASGTAPFVRAALDYANGLGAGTIFLACVPREQVTMNVTVDIRAVTGPEVLTGSTRLKAGTATKLVLNTISTGAMVKLGKVYGNLMVDVAVKNQKLRDRAARIVMAVTDVDRSMAEATLDKASWHAKTAIVMLKKGISSDAAKTLLDAHAGNLRAVIG